MVDDDPIDALAREHEQLDAVLARLPLATWDAPSAAPGWTVTDVLLHLAQSEEFVPVVAAHGEFVQRPPGVELDQLMDMQVAGERGVTGPEVLERWRRACKASVATLRECPRDARLPWATVPLSPWTLASTRIAEHWAHALDITEPFGIDYPDTERLWHVARLAHRTLPYAFTVAGETGGPVRCELVGPNGDSWIFGDADAESVIRGSAAEFCRVGAQRLTAGKSLLSATGPYAAAALRVVRNYAV
ncbi:maleylpyruvate isomerase family mycothiol-dependent enzyme [Nocardia sp. NPDC052566]|uniref:maleylpyruvate isomerase family mycothiol-dependent enzyme n=1 Tax=Nocardia sp. NPDC052566 TaxID=3364330 RepID=UPI0037C7796D